MNIIKPLTDDEKLLIKRCEELYSRADLGTLSTTAVLSPRERYIIENRLGYMFSGGDDSPLCFFWGGFKSAQRTILCFAPSYYRYSLAENGEPFSACRHELTQVIVPLRIKTGGYVKLAHRDFLGAIIGLGVERSSVGDILTDDDGAIVFVSASVCDRKRKNCLYR